MPAQLLAYSCPHCGKMMEVEPTAGDSILTCPNPECQKPFQLEVPRAQPAPALIVPSDAGVDATDTEAPPPVAQVTPMAEPELITVQPQMFRRYPLRCLALVIMILVGVAGMIYGLSNEWMLFTLCSLPIAAYGGLRLLTWWLRDRNTRFTVTTRRSLLRSGVFNGRNIELPHAEVREVHVAQSWRDRLFGIGDLMILGPDAAGAALHVLGVPRAEEIAAMIRSRRQAP
jgi:hypothetical protein